MYNFSCLPSAHILPSSVPMIPISTGVPWVSQEGNYYHGSKGESYDLNRAN